MKQKNFLRIAMLFVFAITSNFSFGQTTIYTLDFESIGGYTTNIVEDIDETTDYFGRIEYGVNTPTPTFSNLQGNFYFGAQDIDGITSTPSLPVTLSIDDVNISGYTSLQLRVYLAEDDDGSNQDWDGPDFVHFSVDIDNTGSFTDVLNIEANGTGTNLSPAIDTNFDGVGNGTEITNTFAQFTSNISGTGSLIDLKVEFSLDSGDEDIAIDHIEIIGTASTAPTVGFDAATSSENETDGTFTVTIPVTASNYDGNQIDLTVSTSGTAEGTDYTLNTTTLTFAANGTQNISLDIIADTDDFDDETIILTIAEGGGTPVTGLVISEATHTVTVTDDETPPTIGFDAATSSQTETDATFNVLIPVTVSSYSGTQIDVSIAASGTAESGDFTLNTATLSFTADGSQNISLDINDDVDADEETIILTITETSAVTGLVISQATHTVTLTDDETPPVPTAGSVFITEVVDGDSFNYDYLELYNNSAETVSLYNSKLVRANASTNASEYVFDFGIDESTADVNITIPAYGFLIIARAGSRTGFNSDYGITLPVAVNYNGGNTNNYFGSARRWRLRTGGTENTDDGTLIDDTLIGVGNDTSYKNIFTGDFTNDNLVNATPGALEYLVHNGGAWVNSVAMDGTTAAKDAYIYDTFTISDDAAINNFGIATGATLTLAATKGLTVNGNLTNNGTLTANPGSSLIVSGTSTGNVTYSRTLTFNADNLKGWHLVSSPVVGETYDDSWITTNSIAPGTGNNRGIATYNNTVASGNWSYFQAGGDTTFNSGAGYSVKRGTSAGTVSFTGTLLTESITDKAITNSTQPYNLLGNPYPSYMNSATFLTDNSAFLSSETIWVWDSSANSGTGAYVTKTTIDGYQIAPGQGFFVSANGNNNVTFNESNQSHQGTDTFSKSENTRPEIKLFINDGTQEMYTKIYYIESTTPGFDNGYDGETFNGLPNSFEVFTHLISDNQGKNFATQSLPNTNYDDMVIPVGVKTAANKEVTFTVDAKNLPGGINIYLEDRQENTFTRLDEENSNFKITFTEAVNNTGRFYLHTSSRSLSTADVFFDSVSIYKTDNSTLRITGLQNQDVSISLFNILGKKVMVTTFKANGLKDITLPKLATGIYVVQLTTENGNLNKKVIIE